MTIWFTSDQHFNHANILKYCGRFEFMNQHERDQFNGIGRKYNDQFSRDDVKHISMSKESVLNMNDRIIQNINERVHIHDHLYILGDLGFFKNAQEIVDIFQRIDCDNIYYIWGNHDDKTMFNQAFKILDRQVKVLGDQCTHLLDGQYFVLNHYPLAVWDMSHYNIDKVAKSIQLYGHTHGSHESKRPPDAMQLDVGVDSWNYKPCSIADILERLRLEGRIL